MSNILPSDTENEKSNDSDSLSESENDEIKEKLLKRTITYNIGSPQIKIMRQNSIEVRRQKQTDPGRRFTFISNWPHLTTRGWYRCQLCNVYECRREEFERHLRSEAHKLKRRTSKDCGRDDASAYFCDGENEQHSLGTDIK